MYQNKRSYRPVKPRRLASSKWLFILAGILVAGALLAGGLLFVKNRQGESSTSKTQQNGQAAPSFDKNKFSRTDPTSLWVIVNKKHPLQPKTYVPADLRTPNMAADAGEQVNSQTATALEALSQAAAADGLSFKLASGYRSYDKQVSIYDSEVRGYGQAQADRESARPGYSEHQSGWAADLAPASGKCDVEACFADTPEGKWLAANAYKYGFVIRYAEGKEHVTGYMYEPWHVRYVGTELSTEMHNKNIQTLEEFFNLPAAAEYN